MKLIDYVQSLMGRLSKNDILEDVEISKKELSTVLLPMANGVNEIFINGKYNSKDAESICNIFSRNYSQSKNKNIITEINFQLPNVISNVEYVEKELTDLLERDIIKEGLTAKKSVLIRTAECISYFSKMSVDIINFICDAELYHATKSDTYKVTPYREKQAMGSILTFSKVFNILAMPKKEFEKKLASMPDVTINNSTAAAVSGVWSEDKLDPISAGFISGFTGSPIYHLRLMVAEWQADRYKLMSEKKRELELKLLGLKLMQESGSDAALEKEISYIQNRVEKIEYKVKKMEESVA